MSDNAPANPNPPAAGPTATATRLIPQKPKLDHLPPFKVLLHNDDVNTPEHVIDTIIEVTTIQKQRAVELMLEAHRTGVALVMVTHKEAAEHFHDQFKSKSLTVTIEPA
ncbi:hypothetical protein PHYC_01189 [Phycisphaerales bacterium]|nr:hypothetical protein PHYC_01189 [Phycisphaerales bacterium]